MHEAYEVVSVLKLAEQIESISAYDDNLLVATRQGNLMMYLVTPTNETPKYKIQVLRYHKMFSKKPIQQIEVIPENDLLLCLSDNILIIHDIKVIHFPIVQTMQDTKGATLFSLDNKKENEILRLAVAVKRKIQLYEMNNNKFEPQHVITVPDIPKVISWGLNYVCVGFKDEYILYTVDGKEKEQFLTSSSRSTEPCITKISDTSFLLGRDQSSVIVEETAPTMPSDNIIKVKEPMIAAVWDNPYVLGLISDQAIIHTIEPPMFIQTLSDLNRARFLYKSNKGLIYAASVSQVWRIKSTDISKQRNTLINDKHFELALKLTELSNESNETKKQITGIIQKLHALELFKNKSYKESMDIFLNLNTNPSEVINLFPEFSSEQSEDVEEEHELVPKNNADLENGILVLIEYLRQVRQKCKNSIILEKNESIIQENKAQLKIIDTTLLKCYLQTNDAFIGPLLRRNNCIFEEAEQVLMKHQKYSELIILYQTNKQHTKALQFMKDQAKQPDSILKGYDRTKIYLQQLGAEHMNFIFQFSNWVLAENPEEGLKIFTDDVEEVEKFPRPKVLDFLLREHEALVIPYLEHIIYMWKDQSPVFHNAFVRKLRDKILDKTTTEAENKHMRAKLLSFLEKSNNYSPEMVLVHFPTDSLFEERAIVLGKLDSHEQALSIYIYYLGDKERAIHYCDSVSQRVPENKKNHDVYIILIRLLINPTQELLLKGPLRNVPRSPNKLEPDVETAIQLLEKHANKIDPIKALAALPDTLPISKIKTFLEIAIHNQLINRRKMEVLKGLLHAESLQVQELQMIHQSQSVIIADYNVCPVCKKRFGNQSAFVRYPNGDIVHYSCHDL